MGPYTACIVSNVRIGSVVVRALDLRSTGRSFHSCTCSNAGQVVNTHLHA